MLSWKNALNLTIDISVLTKTLPMKGNLVYEYNPFRNYRLTKDMYEYNDRLYTEDELEDKHGIRWCPFALDDRQTVNVIETTDVDGNKTISLNEPDYKGQPGSWVKSLKIENGVATYIPVNDEVSTRLKGELVDFDTSELNFDLNHPVNIIPQYSYDGSVNLILNDGKNHPRMINSRFSATGKNTYEIVDRKGSNDTNIYDQGDLFDIDTSLYKRIKQIPKLRLKSVDSGGALKCGNYHFYFKLADTDGNETDFVAESGLVSIFVGNHYPQAIYSGNRDENTLKQVTFILSNIDPSYNYVYVYYSRYTAEDGDNKSTFYKKIDKRYLVNNSGESKIIINGFEEDIDATREDINLSYNIIDSAECQTTALSMLFLGNVHKPNIPYEELTDLSLRFLPYLKDEKYEIDDIDLNYNIPGKNKGYYDPVYIYNNLGYWDLEIYRLGIVYILSNGEFSSVFNIRGRENVEVFKADEKNEAYDSQYSHFNFEKDTKEKIKIKFNESNYLVIHPSVDEGELKSDAEFENVKGVISLKSNQDSRMVHAIEIRVENETIERLKKLGIKGYFFVRLSRMPLTLAQGITLGIDKEGRVPTIPTSEGMIDELYTELNAKDNYVEGDFDKVCFISEGFLSRYKFDLKPKGSSIWSKLGKIALVTAIVAGCVAGAIVTAGTGTGLVTWAGAAAVGNFLGASTAIGAAITIGGISAGTALAVGSIAGGIDSLAKHNSRNKAENRVLNKRKTEVHNGLKIVEKDSSRLLGASFKSRVIIKNGDKNDVGALICPDYDVAPHHYNQLFTGSEFILKTAKSQVDYKSNYKACSDKKDCYFFNNEERHFYMPYKKYTDTPLKIYTSKLQAVPDNVACITIGKTKFRSKAGNQSEAWKYECIGDDYKQTPSSFSTSEDNVEQSTSQEQLTDKEIKKESEDKQINSDIVRGSYGPYIGMVDYNGTFGETVSVMIPGYDENLMYDYFQIRMDDISPFFAISDRIDINNLKEYYVQSSCLRGDDSVNKDCKFLLHRGDCYICQFTHRVIRNFNDDTAPYNSIVVDSKSWKNHYLVEKAEEFSKINVGDVNAVDIGMWITFTVRSNRNLNIRSLDGSVIEETVKMGHPRGFFPYHGMIAEGSYKSPEALVYNDGFTTNLGERFNFILPDAPWIKNWYGTRIMYSDIHVNDGYKNGFRVFRGLNYRDYTRQYGVITKLINFTENILVVFEHGLAIIPVNERAVAAQGAGGYAYINTSNVLPENPNIISETYGSTWSDSVLLVPGDGADIKPMVFGVDTVAKKIWIYNGGNSISLISDFKVQEFLNLNLTFTEREKEPLMGIRNVKTVYNAYKHDVMFTFYDDLIGTEEKVWNLCYNVLLGKFTTFYSWVPSYMENINNIPFSFDRTVSKWIAKLGQTHADNSFANGIVLDNNIYNNDGSIDNSPYINYKYLTKSNEYNTKKVRVSDKHGLIGVFNLLDHILPQGDNIQFFVKFDLIRDIYGFYKTFEIREIGQFEFVPEDNAKYNNPIKVYGLFFKEDYLSKVISEKNGEERVVQLNNTNSGLKNSYQKEREFYFSELYYRNWAGHTYNDYDDYKVTVESRDNLHCVIKNLNEDKIKLLTDNGINVEGDSIKLTDTNYFKVVQLLNLPVFHSRDGNRPSLEKPINKNKLVQLLNIKATIYAKYANTSNDKSYLNFMNYIKSDSNEYTKDLQFDGWINAGTYESSIAITSQWNLQFLDTSFWKHGQAGIIDIKEDIYPTKWYGEQHPFEFEFIVVNDPAVHKIFENLEIISNKARPESFHFEVIGESYDFAKDKPNMYFRQEARKALFLYNGCNISYNRNFRKINPRLQPKSAELVYKYYERQDTMEDIYDAYNLKTDSNTIYTAPYYNFWVSQVPNKDYRHLSGAEITYYPNRLEYRVWQHLPAIDVDTLNPDDSAAILRANCEYLEDKWVVLINPILICYKNEYIRNKPGSLFLPENSTWPNAQNVDGSKSETKLPPITIRNTNLPQAIKEAKRCDFPNEQLGIGKDNALYGLYSWDGNPPIDNTNWLSDFSIYKRNFGADCNREEIDVRDKFVKIRIRYSGKDLAVIDFLNTIYSVSYA